jgi:O-antigen/teichoic acid export membrane protein
MPFLLFSPHLWYYGISALVATVFIAITNRKLTKKLLPDFQISKSLYDFKLVKELVFSGGWNLLSKLSAILSFGLDLLLANLFIGAMAMGTLSISKAVPFIILSLCGSIAVVFAPKLTEFYAKGKTEVLQNELLNNIRIMSVFSVLPLITFLVLGEDFFRLWIPTQDYHVLYMLSSITVFSMLLAMPQESLWNIFTITNKVKMSSINLLIFSILIFVTILIGVSYFENEYHKLLSIVIANLVWGGLRSLSFLPIYGAKCLKLKWNTFYPLIFKNLFVSVSIIVGFFLLKRFITINNWTDFILSAICICAITVVVMGCFMLNKNQKTKLIFLIKERVWHR